MIVNIIPAIVILILNLTLWFFMKNYTKTISAKQFLSEPVNTSVNVRRNITKSQKSHYFTIIILGIWLLFTTIPYNILTTYYWISELRLINIKTRLSLTIQGVSSAFFNLNHCFNIIIYTTFHKDFRLSFKNLLIKLFNLNPMCQLNMNYLKSKQTKKEINQNNKLEMAKLINNNSKNAANSNKSNSAGNIKVAETLAVAKLNLSNCSLNEDITNEKKFPSNHSIAHTTTKYGLFIPKRNFILFRFMSNKTNKTKQSS